MNENENKIIVPESKVETPVSTTVDLPDNVKLTTIDFNELKPNSVVVIKIAAEGMQQRIAATQQIAMALRPLRDIIKEKNIVFLMMGVGEGFDVVDEEEMNAMGWHKKEESRIILPK